MVASAKDIWGIVKETAIKWNDDNISRWAASLSFYALLSMAPLLIVTVFVLGFFFGENSARVQVVNTTTTMMGPHAASAIATVAKNAHASGRLGPIIGIAVALFGASGFFVELQAALNCIWSVPDKNRSLIRGYIVGRFWAFLMVFGVSALLFASVLSNAILSVIIRLFQTLLPGGSFWQFTHWGASLAIAILLFSVVFRFVPETKIPWSDVWLGSFITALLFILGDLLLGLYLGTSGFTSSFGGAGSVIALVLWVYYSAQIILLGAEFTEVYSRRLGSRSAAPIDSASNDTMPS